MSIFYWIVEYISSFVEVIMCNYFCGTVLDKEHLKEKKKTVLIVSLLTAIFAILCNRIKLFSMVTAYVFIVALVLTQWILYKKRYLFSGALVAIFLVLMSTIDFSVVHLVAMLLDLELAYVTGVQSMVRVVCMLVAKSILIIVVMTFHRIYQGKQLIPNGYIVILSLCSGFLLISNFVMMQSGFGVDMEQIGVFSMIFFIMSLGIELAMFFFFFKVADNYEIKKTASLIELNNKMLLKSLDDTQQAFGLWRESIHDYKNNILTLTQMAEDGDIEKIKEYLKKENDLIQRKMFYIKTGNSIVDTIVNNKQATAERKGILFEVHAKLSQASRIEAIDLGNILGNLIDNAITASEQEENGFIDIRIEEQQQYLVICIRNKCTVPIAENLETSKADKTFHGIGLKSVKKAVEKYNGTFTYEVKNEQFKVNILLENN